MTFYLVTTCFSNRKLMLLWIKY